MSPCFWMAVWTFMPRFRSTVPSSQLWGQPSHFCIQSSSAHEGMSVDLAPPLFQRVAPRAFVFRRASSSHAKTPSYCFRILFWASHQSYHGHQTPHRRMSTAQCLLLIASFLTYERCCLGSVAQRWTPALPWDQALEWSSLWVLVRWDSRCTSIRVWIHC